MRSGMPTSLIHIYIQKWKLHISGITRFPFHCESASQSLCQMAEVLVGLGSFQVKKKEGSDKKRQKKKKTLRRLHFSPCGRFESLHGQPYPAAPQKLFHVQQVDSQSGLQLLAHSLRAPAVRAVHGHAQEWHQQEEASEEGEMGAGLCRLIGCEHKNIQQVFTISCLRMSIWIDLSLDWRTEEGKLCGGGGCDVITYSIYSAVWRKLCFQTEF